MRPVLTARFALFVALVAGQYGALASPLWPTQPALALEEPSAAATKGKTGHQFTGMADYYHHSLYGKKTASGQRLEKHLYTAAHRTLPFGTHVHVKNHSNGRSCIVVINDRGPFTKSKVIDLSHSAATELDMIRAGTCKVGCTVVAKPKTLISKAVPEQTAPGATAPVIAVKPTAPVIAVKPTAPVIAAKPTAPAIAMKPVQAKPPSPSTADPNVRADETSAELEGAEPIKWTEVQ